MRPPSFAAVFVLVASALAADTPVLRQTMPLPPDVMVRFTAVSPTGKLVAAACRDNKISLWDVASGTLKNTLDLNGERPKVIQFSPGGELLAAGGEGGTVRLWDSSGALQHEYKFPAEVGALAFAPDLSILAVAPIERPVEVRALTDGKLLASLPASFSGSTALAFSPDGRWLATADADTEIRIIDDHGWTLRARVTDLLLEPLALVFSPDGTRVLAGGADGVVSIIDSRTGKILKASPKQPDILFALCASPDGQSVAGVYFSADQISAPPRVLIWNIPSSSLHPLQSADLEITGGNYLLDGTLLLTSGADKELKVWAVR
jgi:WD40 repeat protein